MCGQTHDIVIYCRFHQNPFRGFGATRGRSLPVSHYFGYWLFTARCYASAVLAMALCPSVCPLQVGVLLKRLNVGSRKQHHTIAQRLQFSDAKDLREIPPGSPPAEAPNAGGVGQNRRLSTNSWLYLENGTSEGPSGGSRAAAAVADGCREVAVLPSSEPGDCSLSACISATTIPVAELVDTWPPISSGSA